MHDIFDASLSDAAAKSGVKRVDAQWITSAQEANKARGSKKLLIATTDEPWVFKASVTMLAHLELEPRRDSLHHRSSGLDSTSAKQCAREGILVGIDLSLLRKRESATFGRVMQNILLCRQHGAAMCVFSNATSAEEIPHEPDVRALLVTLGMSPGEAKAACENLGKAAAKVLKGHA